MWYPVDQSQYFRSKDQSTRVVVVTSENSRICHKRKKVTLRLFKILGEQQQWRCKMCTSLLKSTSQVDHVIPLFEGGTNDPDNLEILCVDCHSRKTQNEVDRQQKRVFTLDPKTLSVKCENCKLIFSRHFAKHKCQ